MKNTLEQNDIFALVAPVVSGLNFQIVDLKTARIRSGLQVTLVIYHPDGVSIQSCADVSRAILPRLEVHSGDRDVHLEVSSPGITRNIKSAHEFAVFIGKEVRILLNDRDVWISGTIESADDASFRLHTADSEPLNIRHDDIHKAKLAG